MYTTNTVCRRGNGRSLPAERVRSTESIVWNRQQVLPGRTHPHNNMSSCGGFVLTGIKVLNNKDPRGVLPAARPAAEGAKARKRRRYRR